MNKSRTEENKVTFPERIEGLLNAQAILQDIEELLIIDPENKIAINMLAKAKSILNVVKELDRQAFLRYAHELSIKVQEDDYPYSIKTWYEDDFVHLLEDYGDAH